MKSEGQPKDTKEETNTPKTLMQKLDPGLITGAADDDPSGIATYSQAGAQFGNNVLWTIVITYPLMVAIQMVSASIGRVTGRGLAEIMMRHNPRSLVYTIVSMLLIAKLRRDMQCLAHVENLDRRRRQLQQPASVFLAPRMLRANSPA